MTLQHVTHDLAAQALTKPGITHKLTLKRGLRLALRYRRYHYTLSIARNDVFPSVAEKAILRAAFDIPQHRKWRPNRRAHWHIWYIFWNPDEALTDPVALARRQLPIDWPAGVGPAAAAPPQPGDPT